MLRRSLSLFAFSPLCCLYSFLFPVPAAVFELNYFRRNPHPFLLLARELYPTGAFRPTPAHHFIRALAEYSGAAAGAETSQANGAEAPSAATAESKAASPTKADGTSASEARGRLLRNFTQNIDGLEIVAGLADHKLIQAHGGFGRAACIDCQRSYPASFFQQAVFADPPGVPRCTDPQCTPPSGGLVKPCITFFGESLPAPFARAVAQDFPQCDLLVVMGTSLQVQPFASLISRVGKHVPRVLINNECVGASVSAGDDADEEEEEEVLRSNPQYVALLDQLSHCRSEKMRPLLQSMIDTLRTRLLGGSDDKFDFRSGRRDVFLRGDCDSGVKHFARLIGPEFEALFNSLIEADKATAAADSAKNGGPAGAPASTAASGGAGASAEAMAKAIAASVGGAAASSSSSSPSKPSASAGGAASSSSSAAAPSITARPTSASAVSAPRSRFAVGFDFDHTLGIDHGLELNALRALAGEFGPEGLSLAASENFSKEMSKALKEYRDGRTTQADMIRAFAALMAHPLAEGVDAVEDLRSRFRAHCFKLAPRSTPMSGALELLAWLRSKSIPVAILTNGWSPLQQQKISAALGDAAPGTILVSDELGALKPDARSFRAMMSAPGFAGLDPSAVVYVGDNPSGDVVGAMDAGLKGMWLDAEEVPYPEDKRRPDWTVHALSEVRPILERWRTDEEGKDRARATPIAQSAL